MSNRFIKTLAGVLAILLAASCAMICVMALEPSGNGVKIRNWVTNDPDYSFSEAYKTSVWYENFSSLTLTENQRNNILRVAVSQLGYHEGDSAKDFDGMNRGGSNNYIEYARLIVPNYNDNHYEWCACFVNWCLNQAGIDYAYGEIGCWKWVEWLKPNRMFQNSAAYKGSYTPQPADMIFFNWSNNNKGADHIGYVLYVTEDRVYTIEGNSKDEVGIRNYDINDPCIIGYGTPPYEEGSELTIDFSYTDGLPVGKYVVHLANTSLTDAPAARKRIARMPLGACVTVTGTEDKYARVLYEDKEGYIPIESLCLMTPGHTAVFKAGDETVSRIVFTDGDEIAPPEVPAKEGYNGTWPEFEIVQDDFTVKAEYTPVEYTVTFTADGFVVGTAAFTVEDLSVTPPAVPDKPGYGGVWPSFTLGAADLTVEAEYFPLPETEPPTLSTDDAESSRGTDDTGPDSEGCSSSVQGFALLPLLGTAAAFRKKKRH